jgi:hypothetical protein
LPPPVFGLRTVCHVASLLLYKKQHIYEYIMNVKRYVTSLSNDPRCYCARSLMLRPVLLASDEDSGRLCCYDACKVINSQSWKGMRHFILQGLEPLMINSAYYYETSKISDCPTRPNSPSWMLYTFVRKLANFIDLFCIKPQTTRPYSQQSTTQRSVFIETKVVVKWTSLYL